MNGTTVFHDAASEAGPMHSNPVFPAMQPVDEAVSQPPITKPANLGKPMPREPFIIEICAGSARVTSCLKALGLAASFWR